MDNVKHDAVTKIDTMIHEYINNIDWTNYENVDDVDNVDLAKNINLKYHDETSNDLLATSKDFKDTKAGDTVRQGKLILKAMADLAKISDHDLEP